MRVGMRFKKSLICVLIVLFAILVAVSCTYYHLSRRLPADIKDWYELHSPLMDSKVPLWIDANNRTESQHFLKMPTHVQETYIYEYFWQMRHPEMRDVFYSRLNYVRVFFSQAVNPWNDHRGRVLLLAGEPTWVRYYRHGTEQAESAMPEGGDILEWYYFMRGVGECRYYFEFTPPDTWRLSMGTGLRAMGNRDMFERRCREEFEPTPEGWVSYAEYLYEVIKEGE